MASPLVSILVPVYNVELYIERCARSLFEQTYDNLEFVFVNDCTPDKSIQILETVITDYPARAERIRIIHHEHNRGIGTTRNTLIDNSNGEFVFFVDSDDWVETNSVELLVAKQQETDADIITGQRIAHFPDGECPFLTCGWDMDKDTMIEKVLKGECSTIVIGRLIRTSLFRSNSIRCMDGVTYEDRQIFPQLIYYCKSVAGVDMIVYHHFKMNVNSITYNYLGKRQVQCDGILSSRFLIDFFKKESELHYMEICEEELVKRIYYLMVRHLKNHNREDYKHMVTELKKTDSRYWHLIGWDNWSVRLLESNWILLNCRKFLRKVLRKMKKIFTRYKSMC